MKTKETVDAEGWINFIPIILPEGSVFSHKKGLTSYITPDGNEINAYYQVKNNKLNVKFRTVKVNFIKRLINKIINYKKSFAYTFKPYKS